MIIRKKTNIPDHYYSRKTNKRAFHFKLGLFVALISNLVVGWGVNSGEDITNSRANFLSTGRNNFLGSFAGFAYGKVPNNPLNWWQVLLLTQGLLAALGLYLLFRNKLNSCSKRSLITLQAYCFISIHLGMALTRDGAMISLALFGFSLLNFNPKRLQIRLLGLLTLIIAFGFRPWLGVCLAPLLYLLFQSSLVKSKLLASVLALFISLAPAGLEALTASASNIEDAFPQQTFMLHDLASSYCLSTNQSTRDAAFSELARNTNSGISILQICEFYKPSTWQSIILPNKGDARISKLEAPIRIIQPGDLNNFNQLQNSWMRIIKKDPSSYLQNHLYFLSQVLISGESRALTLPQVISQFTSLIEAQEVFKLLCAFIQTPAELLVRLHIISPAITIVGLVILFLRKRELVNNRYVAASAQTLALWVIITTAGFVSDNGRYTYLPVLIVWGTIIYQKNAKAIQV